MVVIKMKQRNTIQRQLLLEAVKSLKTHPTAEDVYQAVLREYPHISLGTVYRNLNLLAANGEIGKICVPDAADRFDKNQHSHYHARCTGCGRFADLDADYCSEIDEMIEDRTGFKIGRHSLIFDGLCPKCRKAAPEAENVQPDGAGASASR